MEEYLRRPDVPDFLKPINTASAYLNVNLSDPKKYHDANYKYHQYFANLNNNASSDSTFYPTDNFSYYKNHKVYRPAFTYNPTDKADMEEISNSKRKKEKKSFQSFDSFINVPTLFSDEDLTGLSYHTAVDMPDGIYLFGGLQALQTNEYEERLKLITKNFTIPPENIKIVCDYDLPLPMDKQKFESICLVPYRRMSKYSTESKSIKYVCSIAEDDEFIDTSDDGTTHKISINNKKGTNLNLKAFATATQEHSSSTTNTLSNTSSFLNTCPKSLICSGGAKLSDRFFMIYGGLEMDTKIYFPNDNHCVIEKVLIPNDEFWLFDRIKCHFREIKLSVHPTYSTIFPSSIPRFGHSMASIPMDDMSTYIAASNSAAALAASAAANNNSDALRLALNSSYSKPATMFVMGGYKLNSNGKSFIAMNDLWKCDFFLDANGTADEAIACPIGDFNVANDVLSYILDENMKQLRNRTNLPKFTGVFSHSTDEFNWPAPRGFHSMCLVDSIELSPYINWKKLDNKSEDIDEETETDTANNSTLDRLKMSVPVPMKKSYLNHVHSNEMADISDVLKGNPTGFGNNPNEAFRTSPSSVSKTDFKVKDMFNKPDFSSGNFTPTRSIHTFSSDSSVNAATASSHSPYSAHYLHTNTNTITRNKLLIISGGSSILYTKVVNDKKYDVFYNNTIHSDIWIFDFQTENWYNFEKFIDMAKKISVCGHTMFVSGGALRLFGGIEDLNYSDDMYNVVHAGVYEDNSSSEELKVQDTNWEEGRIVAQNFHEYLRYQANPSNTVIEGIDVNMDKTLKDYNYYTNHEFSLKALRWKLIKVAVVQDLKFCAPWDPKKNFKVIAGGMVDEITIKERETLVDKKIIYTHCPSFIKDSKIIMFAPDVKIVDRVTNKYIVGAQNMVGNGLCEIFSGHL